MIFSCGNENTEKGFAGDFIPEQLEEYHIDCERNDFNTIYENYRENNYIPITIKFKGESRKAKMRVRGDTSRKDAKKSLKVKLDSSFSFFNETVFNLNAEYSDKTMVRQYLSSKLMQKSGQICFNSELVKIYMNGQYLGLYLKVENIDKAFLKRNSLSPKGNLYKATKDGACLSIFDDFDAKWEKKTNKKGDYHDLTKLIDQLNNVPDHEFYSFIKKNFEYEELINILSLNMFLSNGSTYYHNYYLYHDLYYTGKWQLLPWDMDKSLSYYNWKPYLYHRTSSEWESDNPLVERAILCKPMFEDIQKRLAELHQTTLNDQQFSPIIDKMMLLLEDVIELDTMDNIKNKKEWVSSISREKEYFNKHYDLLQEQMNEHPLSFNVHRFKQTQTGAVTFRWDKAKHKQEKPITYVLSYGSDFLLLDSSRTNYVLNIKDTFFTLSENLPDGTYYWKITAFDGEHYTDGFNTKNIFEVKRGTPVNKVLSRNQTFIKEESPYVVSEDVTINENVTLRINPGVEIHLKENVNINCNGSIISTGTSKEPVIFMPDNASKEWGYIYFYEPAQMAYLKNTILMEGTINSKKTNLTLDSSSILVDKKFMGDGWEKRKVLIYSGDGVVHVKNSTFKSNGEGEGMVLFYGEAITENSSFNNVPDAIEYIGVNKGIIRNNFVTNSPDDAIDLNACNNVLIERNILIGNKDKAISIGTEQYGPSVKNIQINNNLIIGNKTGIAVKDSSVAYINNNTLFKNISGINAYKKREDYKKGGVAYIKNTIFDKNEKTNAYADKLSSVEVNNSIVHNKVLGGRENIKGNPQFIDAKNNNFHLRKESPCLDKGESGETLGAFNSESTALSISEIGMKTNKENKSCYWIKIENNYNISMNLSLHKVVITRGEKVKEFTFPLGINLEGLQHLILTNKYPVFKKFYTGKDLVLDGLSKLGTRDVNIQLIDMNGYEIDSYQFSVSGENKKRDFLLLPNKSKQAK